MDYLSLIKLPIEAELADFIDLFNKSLMHSDGLLSQVLDHIRQRAGKRMRPILILLMARNFGKVSSVTQHSAVGLELLHTASLVHDDVVDESGERRGQASVNATYNNKVAVLVGDFILSTALLHVSYSHSEEIVRYLAELGRILSNGKFFSEDYEGLCDDIQELKETCGEHKMKCILETGDLKNCSNIMKASILAMYSGSDYIKTSTGKEKVSATPEAAYVMCQAIKAYYEKTGIQIGFKPAGGINTVHDAVVYYTIVKEVLGEKWLTNQWLRLGTSRLTNLLLSEILGKEIKYF
jgi:deoxyribose-phosphate aldolase